ncbi:MAG TPA: Gfo/Idh/MocA family oxidoreductase [Vicinamibacterales bacterium]|nr:Gfo/Idh/MocA family oxidoreductase [Vicinamibacterales bacterium]
MSGQLRRREFLASGVGVAAAALSSSSTLRAQGANDRIGLAIIGCGVRGPYLLEQALKAAPGQIQVVALCDVWSVARERLAAQVVEKLGQKPRLVSRHQDVMTMPDVDGVIIATPDFAHCPQLIDAVRAGKDAFVEKPLTTRLEDAVAALDAVEKSDRIVQVGTQRRSLADFRFAADYVKSGALGKICKVETAWNRNVASWNRPVDMVRREDVDWEQYLMYLPRREFDPVRYRRWQWFHDYTTGLVGLLGSHMLDVANWFMDDPFPTSAVALGGIKTWKDGREISDTAEYVFEYPKDWICTFSSRLGSGPEEDYEIFFGNERKLDSRDWVSRPANHVRPPDAKDIKLEVPPQVEHGHVGNWLECMRTRRQPNAPIQAGFAHAVACCLGREAERTGRKMQYDPVNRRIVEATT